MQNDQVDYNELIKALSDAGVEFIVVGDLCAVLHDSPIPMTIKIEVVYSIDPQNLSRLEKALQQLDAYYRMKPEAAPDANQLNGPGHHLLITRFGPLDLLGSTVGGQGYDELIQNTEEIELGAGAVRILDLQTLISIKESLASDRDKAILPILRRTLKERGGK